MILEAICRKIAKKELDHPDFFVECMHDGYLSSIKKGEILRVIKNRNPKESPYICLENGWSYMAKFFRKVDLI